MILHDCANTSRCGIEGGGIRQHEEILEKERIEAIPEEERAKEAELQRLQKIGHKSFDRGSLHREFGSLANEKEFPKNHISYGAHGSKRAKGQHTVQHNDSI